MLGDEEVEEVGDDGGGALGEEEAGHCSWSVGSWLGKWRAPLGGGVGRLGGGELLGEEEEKEEDREEDGGPVVGVLLLEEMVGWRQDEGEGGGGPLLLDGVEGGLQS